MMDVQSNLLTGQKPYLQLRLDELGVAADCLRVAGDVSTGLADPKVELRLVDCT